ncbi:DUF948 domain-containing protein [Caldisericum exile]|uniref:DUF948 domain-containing protein n=1 Tax=Caldisericum exile (strain DSM 21853 / NBRC 104410 / AZM16c01) TaxID=511051 RepID=A0A7U6JGN3_CALEA|nr:DUF948 domain-containing protein [Caldisericum exile]BAL80497.1 hypothetical protein CSE_03710 [Caldisericum exile AZM16c01]
MSLTIAVWIIAISLLLGVAGTFIFLLNFQRDITKTLTEVEITLKTLQKNIDAISYELEKTLKNTTGITEETKNLIRNINTITSLNAIFTPLTQIGSQKDIISRILNIGKIALGVVQGYNLYKKLTGGKNERE